MEPVVGIEPTTYGLRNRCSATELHWLGQQRGLTYRGRVLRQGKTDAKSILAWGWGLFSCCGEAGGEFQHGDDAFLEIGCRERESLFEREGVGDVEFA
ncbi:MAG: hypothetical protein RI897_3153 [Verrucomicrobiota bacterium]